MGIFVLFLLPFRVLSIFGGFTFTDFEDFLPLLTLIIGLVCAALIRRSKQKKASIPLVLSMILLSFGALLPNIGLYFLAREFQSVRGYWPQVFVNTPWDRLGIVSPKYDALFHLVGYLEAFSGAWLTIFLVLFSLLNSQFSERLQSIFICLVISALVIAFLDPGNLYAWWLD